MKIRVLLLFLVTGIWSAAGGAADSGERTYADPACSARDANPEKCFVKDGAPRRAGNETATAPGGNITPSSTSAAGSLSVGGAPAPIGGGFTPKAAKK